MTQIQHQSPSISPSDALRERQEAFERQFLVPQAALACASRGRERDEPECPLRTVYQRDRDRILHAKSFRRLKHKTQVFIAPEGDHYRTRLTHTLEVAQIARTVSRALRLNEDLTEAIALGHDLGHAPFGHAGERVLDTLYAPGFSHNEQSVRVVSLLEPMNLTHEVKDGILHHTGPGVPFTREGQVVKIADRIAYLNHDIDDALRAGILDADELPPFIFSSFGKSKGARIQAMVLDLIAGSLPDLEVIRMTPSFQEHFLALRQFMFQRVYRDSRAKTEEGKVEGIIEGLYRHYLSHPEKIPTGLAGDDISRTVVDHIAGMTDRFAIAQYAQIFLPRAWCLADEAILPGRP